MKERPKQELVDEALNAIQRSLQRGLIHHIGQRRLYVNTDLDSVAFTIRNSG